MNQTADLRPPRLAVASERRRLTSDPRPRRLGIGLILFLLLFQFWSRYLPNPSAVFVVDDWSNWARSTFYTSYSEAFLTGLKDPNRPLSMAAVESVFRLFGDEARAWTAVSVIGNSALLLMLVLMTWELTGRKGTALIAGLLYCLFPNLTETFHWSTQVLNEVSCALVFYGLSGWMWIAYQRRGGGWRLAVSVFAYAIALFSYEAGVLLPGAYMALLAWRRQPIGSLLRMVPFGVVVLAYAGWRITNAFGLNDSWYYPPHMQAGISVGGILWNVREIGHAWLGDDMGRALLNGWEAFATLPGAVRWPLILGNLLVATAILIGLARLFRSQSVDEKDLTGRGALLFGIFWVAASLAIPVLSYTAPRLQVLPALGIALVLAQVLARGSMRTVAMVLSLIALAVLPANQGTSESYRQSGLINRRLFESLDSEVETWRTLDAILLDTYSVRQRLMPGVLEPVDDRQESWAQLGNALLIRGFATRSMVQLILRDPNPRIMTWHDVENGVVQQGGHVVWHERYNPAVTGTTSVDRVHRVDLGRVVWDLPQAVANP